MSASDFSNFQHTPAVVVQAAGDAGTGDLHNLHSHVLDSYPMLKDAPAYKMSASHDLLSATCPPQISHDMSEYELECENTVMQIEKLVSGPRTTAQMQLTADYVGQLFRILENAAKTSRRGLIRVLRQHLIYTLITQPRVRHAFCEVGDWATSLGRIFFISRSEDDETPLNSETLELVRTQATLITLLHLHHMRHRQSSPSDKEGRSEIEIADHGSIQHTLFQFRTLVGPGEHLVATTRLLLMTLITAIARQTEVVFKPDCPEFGLSMSEIVKNLLDLFGFATNFVLFTKGQDEMTEHDIMLLRECVNRSSSQTERLVGINYAEAHSTPNAGSVKTKKNKSLLQRLLTFPFRLREAKVEDCKPGLGNPCTGVPNHTTTISLQTSNFRIRLANGKCIDLPLVQALCQAYTSVHRTLTTLLREKSATNRTCTQFKDIETILETDLKGLSAIASFMKLLEQDATYFDVSPRVGSTPTQPRSLTSAGLGLSKLGSGAVANDRCTHGTESLSPKACLRGQNSTNSPPLDDLLTELLTSDNPSSAQPTTSTDLRRKSHAYTAPLTDIQRAAATSIISSGVSTENSELNVDDLLFSTPETNHTDLSSKNESSRRLGDAANKGGLPVGRSSMVTLHPSRPHRSSTGTLDIPRLPLTQSDRLNSNEFQPVPLPMRKSHNGPNLNNHVRRDRAGTATIHRVSSSNAIHDSLGSPIVSLEYPRRTPELSTLHDTSARGAVGEQIRDSDENAELTVPDLQRVASNPSSNTDNSRLRCGTQTPEPLRRASHQSQAYLKFERSFSRDTLGENRNQQGLTPRGPGLSLEKSEVAEFAAALIALQCLKDLKLSQNELQDMLMQERYRVVHLSRTMSYHDISGVANSLIRFCPDVESRPLPSPTDNTDDQVHPQCALSNALMMGQVYSSVENAELNGTRDAHGHSRAPMRARSRTASAKMYSATMPQRLNQASLRSMESPGNADCSESPDTSICISPALRFDENTPLNARLSEDDSHQVTLASKGCFKHTYRHFASRMARNRRCNSLQTSSTQWSDQESVVSNGQVRAQSCGNARDISLTPLDPRQCTPEESSSALPTPTSSSASAMSSMALPPRLIDTMSQPSRSGSRSSAGIKFLSQYELMQRLQQRVVNRDSGSLEGRSAFIFRDGKVQLLKDTNKIDHGASDAVVASPGAPTSPATNTRDLQKESTSQSDELDSPPPPPPPPIPAEGLGELPMPEQPHETREDLPVITDNLILCVDEQVHQRTNIKEPRRVPDPFSMVSADLAIKVEDPDHYVHPAHWHDVDDDENPPLSQLQISRATSINDLPRGIENDYRGSKVESMPSKSECSRLTRNLEYLGDDTETCCHTENIAPSPTIKGNAIKKNPTLTPDATTPGHDLNGYQPRSQSNKYNVHRPYSSAVLRTPVLGSESKHAVLSPNTRSLSSISIRLNSTANAAQLDHQCNLDLSSPFQKLRQRGNQSCETASFSTATDQHPSGDQSARETLTVMAGSPQDSQTPCRSPNAVSDILPTAHAVTNGQRGIPSPKFGLTAASNITRCTKGTKTAPKKTRRRRVKTHKRRSNVNVAISTGSTNERKGSINTTVPSPPTLPLPDVPRPSSVETRPVTCAKMLPPNLPLPPIPIAGLRLSVSSNEGEREVNQPSPVLPNFSNQGSLDDAANSHTEGIEGKCRLVVPNLPMLNVDTEDSRSSSPSEAKFVDEEFFMLPADRRVTASIAAAAAAAVAPTPTETNSGLLDTGFLCKHERRKKTGAVVLSAEVRAPQMTGFHICPQAGSDPDDGFHLANNTRYMVRDDEISILQLEPNALDPEGEECHNSTLGDRTDTLMRNDSDCESLRKCLTDTHARLGVSGKHPVMFRSNSNSVGMNQCPPIKPHWYVVGAYDIAAGNSDYCTPLANTKLSQYPLTNRKRTSGASSSVQYPPYEPNLRSAVSAPVQVPSLSGVTCTTKELPTIDLHKEPENSAFPVKGPNEIPSRDRIQSPSRSDGETQSSGRQGSIDDENFSLLRLHLRDRNRHARGYPHCGYPRTPNENLQPNVQTPPQKVVSDENQIEPKLNLPFAAVQCRLTSIPATPSMSTTVDFHKPPLSVRSAQQLPRATARLQNPEQSDVRPHGTAQFVGSIYLISDQQWVLLNCDSAQVTQNETSLGTPVVPLDNCQQQLSHSARGKEAGLIAHHRSSSQDGGPNASLRARAIAPSQVPQAPANTQLQYRAQLLQRRHSFSVNRKRLGDISSVNTDAAVNEVDAFEDDPDTVE